MVEPTGEKNNLIHPIGDARNRQAGTGLFARVRAQAPVPAHGGQEVFGELTDERQFSGGYREGRFGKGCSLEYHRDLNGVSLRDATMTWVYSG